VLPVAEQAWGIVVGGVGGTGVITIGQLLGMAAHVDGKAVVTQDSGGLAQKGGATWSHVQIANRPEALFTSKVDMAKADLVIGCDPIVTASKATLTVAHAGRTYVALNSHGTPTAAFVNNPNWQFPEASCEAAIADAVGREGLGAFDAEEVAVQLLGDSIYTNPLMLGYAWQKGRVPLSRAAVLRTITLPYLRPALVGAAAISFLMSFENFNTTLMLVGSDSPLTVMMYGRMREGATPVLNAVSLFLMLASGLLALTLLRRSAKSR
jgi:indolepyruvate ferredoxin oxidoreductase